MDYTESNKVLEDFMNKAYFGVGNYHTSWNWIMPVVDKILSINHQNITVNVGLDNHICIRDTLYLLKSGNVKYTGPTLSFFEKYKGFPTLYDFCVQYIKLHNQL